MFNFNNYSFVYRDSRDNNRISTTPKGNGERIFNAIRDILDTYGIKVSDMDSTPVVGYYYALSDREDPNEEGTVYEDKVALINITSFSSFTISIRETGDFFIIEDVFDYPYRSEFLSYSGE